MSYKNQGMNWIGKRRSRIYARDKNQCIYCGAPSALGARLSLDHIKSHVVAGERNNESSNLVCACVSCNSSKGSKTLELFLEYLVDRKGWKVTETLQIRKRIRVQTQTDLPAGENKQLSLFGGK